MTRDLGDLPDVDLSDAALIFLDVHGRAPERARRLLAQVIWRRDRKRPEARVSVHLPPGCLPLGEEPDLAIPPRWHPFDHPGSCDLCGVGFGPRIGFGCVADGPAFEGVRFEEMFLSCPGCPSSLRGARADRDRLLIEQGVVASAHEAAEVFNAAVAKHRAERETKRVRPAPEDA